MQLEEAFLWHIEDILLDTYPDLRTRLKNDTPPIPIVNAVPVHKTEQYPLPALPIDKSSIDGTLDILETLVQTVLQLSESDIKRHGVILCGSDQLINSLVDKVGLIYMSCLHALTTFG